MRVSQLMGTTLRQVSAEYIFEAEGLLLRAGYLRLVSTGNPAYLHLGQKTIEKIADSFLQKLQEMGGISVQLPYVKSPEFWQKLNLPTHLPYDSRAVLTHLASGEISSYRQLPGLFYQINNYGKTPVLEFWGLSDGENTGQNQFDQISFAISEYLGSLGLKPRKAFGNPGFSLAKQSWEWVEEIGSGRKMYLSDDGLFSSTTYSPEKTAPESEPPKAVEKVHTPGTASIQDLAAFLQVPALQTAKVVFYTAEVIGKKDPQLIIAVIRGDMDVSEDKVRNQIGALSLRAANEEEIKRVGCFPGFASPINIKRENVIVIADDLIPKITNLVAGANEEDYHLINTCYGRDYEADIVADIVDYRQGSQFANIDSLKGNPLASLVNDHTWYSELFQASFMGTQGRPELIHLNYGRIDLHAVMLAVVSQSSDEMGLSWPEAISPYQISLVSLADGEETVEEAEKIYKELQSRGVRVLYDDRHKKVAGPGVKFKDSDLQGIPVRITVSKRALKEGGVEVKKRHESVKEVIAIKDIYSIIT